jgi:hypothetical protein
MTKAIPDIWPPFSNFYRWFGMRRGQPGSGHTIMLNFTDSYPKLTSGPFMRESGEGT